MRLADVLAYRRRDDEQGDLVLRRLTEEAEALYDSARIQVALDRLLSAPTRRVSVKPLVIESWRLRNNLTVADALYVVIPVAVLRVDRATGKRIRKRASCSP